jgi:4-phospho-D-threonate 3-dehydrogenase / 4-phospho-D-erythronate 3-dehydrogenase
VSQIDNSLPIIAITMGDPASIGPEIAVKALQNSETHKICRPVIVGDAAVIKSAIKLTNQIMDVNGITDISDARFKPNTIDVFDLSNVDMNNLEMGKISPMTGKAAFEYVFEAIKMAKSGQVSGTVTGPINKEAINLAGFKFSGHTEIYAHYTDTTKYAMLLVLDNLRVIHVSTHVSLKKACDLVKKDRILDVISLLHNTCRKFGINDPRLGIAGLNPHAGDGGLFGDEEKNEIIPAVKEARNLGFNVDGPIPADTLFSKAKGGSYDGCVAMYHDQGHIPFKLGGFTWDSDLKQMKSVKGVNITLGLPIIRTSVDHGTAMEIAGKGIASPDAMILAIEYAVKMVKGASTK